MSEEIKDAVLASEEPRSASGEPVRLFDAKDIEENKYVAALSYVSILFLIPLLMKKESPFAQFHARQGLVIVIAWIVGSFVFWVPVLGWLLGLALLITDVLALFRTLDGKAWEIPYVKDAVKKLNI